MQFIRDHFIILAFQTISIPIEDFESMRSVHIKYVHSDLTEEEMDIHINKDSNVSDLLDTVKVKLNKEDEKHRLLEVILTNNYLTLYIFMQYVNGRIVTIHERNECITDPNMLASKLYRVEPVPQDQVRS